MKTGNGSLFVVFIEIIPALQICFTGDVVRATALAKSSVYIPSESNLCPDALEHAGL